MTLIQDLWTLPSVEVAKAGKVYMPFMTYKCFCRYCMELSQSADLVSMCCIIYNISDTEYDAS